MAKYLYEKYGFVFSDETELLALKNCLNAENKGWKSAFVERAVDFSVEMLRLNSVIIGNSRHFKSVTPTPPVSSSGVAVTGVVFEDDTGRLFLVDGYHRLKWSLNNGVEEGLFIVLN